MGLKRQFTAHEQKGLTQEEIKVGLKYLRKHKTRGRIPDTEAVKVQEYFMVGATFHELAEQFPEYELGQIILTAAMKGWVHDRDRLLWTIQDRVKARIVKTFVGQIDFISTLLEVNNVEQLRALREYILDPSKQPPANRITNLKEYREICELLMKLGGTGFMSPQGEGGKKGPKKKQPESAAGLLEAAAAAEDDEDGH